MARLRVGICGLGFMGRVHFKRLREHPRAEVVAVADADAARRAGDWNDALGNLDLVAKSGGHVPMEGIAGYATPDELIRDARVDAVVIALPTPLHAPVTLAALAAGKHVLCEKPMAGTVGECNHMLAAAEDNGRTLMVAQCIRFWPQYELIKKQVDEGRIGPVRFAMLRRLGSPPAYSAGNWMLDGRQSGGALLDLHVHDVDFAQYLLGIPGTIHAHGSTGVSGTIDHVVATWEYADGRYAVVEGGWFSPWPFDMEIAVHGERGTLGWALSRGSEVRLAVPGREPEALPCEGDAYARQVDYFVDCVLAARPPERCPPSASRTSIALAWLERRAIETRRTINVSERLREAWEQ